MAETIGCGCCTSIGLFIASLIAIVIGFTNLYNVNNPILFGNTTLFNILNSPNLTLCSNTGLINISHLAGLFAIPALILSFLRCGLSRPKSILGIIFMIISILSLVGSALVIFFSFIDVYCILPRVNPGSIINIIGGALAVLVLLLCLYNFFYVCCTYIRDDETPLIKPIKSQKVEASMSTTINGSIKNTPVIPLKYIDPPPLKDNLNSTLPKNDNFCNGEVSNQPRIYVIGNQQPVTPSINLIQAPPPIQPLPPIPIPMPYYGKLPPLNMNYGPSYSQGNPYLLKRMSQFIPMQRNAKLYGNMNNGGYNNGPYGQNVYGYY